MVARWQEPGSGARRYSVGFGIDSEFSREVVRTRFGRLRTNGLASTETIQKRASGGVTIRMRLKPWRKALIGARRVSTTLRQVFTKFSEFFICCQFSTRKFASGSPRNDDRQLDGPTARPFLSLLGAPCVFPKSIAAGS